MNDTLQSCEVEARPPSRDGEQGYMLLGLMVAIAIILIFLGAAAGKAAFEIRRDREVESARRADQYVRAIRKFYLKTQHYPGSIEQLENTNNIRFLRKRYVDPLTGKGYRLIPVGKNQTTVKGFFGAPLAGIAGAGLGAAAGMQSSGVPGSTTTTTAGAGSPFGSFGGATSGIGGAAGTTGANGAAGTGNTFGTSGFGSTGTAGTPGTTDASGANSGLGSAAGLASNLPGSTGPFMGVGSEGSGNSIITPNEQSTYESWEFLYDPRIEKLKAAAALNAGAGSVGAGTLGPSPGAFTPLNGTSGTNPPNTNGGATPSGSTPSPQP
jgi:type II secretory pathway pseudopilin PulG